MDSTPDLGNRLNRIILAARDQLFQRGELTELTFSAFNLASKYVQQLGTIELSYPVGVRADRQLIQTTRTCTSEELVGRYKYLQIIQLSINEVIQLVTIVEALLSDILRAVALKYPKKLGGAKRHMTLQAVLESVSIEEVHLRATDTLLNELSYKTPKEFAEFMNSMLQVNLLECPAFHRYMEVKATRDIFIHNRGLANDIYVRKAGHQQRVNAGMQLPIDTAYLMESYETCLQLTEWLEAELHNIWYSSELDLRRAQQKEAQAPEGQPQVSEGGPQVPEGGPQVPEGESPPAEAPLVPEEGPQAREP